jgi:hypothetical protein
MTSPVGLDHSSNSLLGYCFLFGSEPFMKENIPHVAQVGVFCGSVEAMRVSEYRQDWRALRAGYSLLASLAAPLVGTIEAMLLVNWLSWAICSWVAWSLTRDVFQSDLAGLLAVVLACGGMGMIVHIGDYSPHLLAFASYYLGIWLIFHSRVYCECASWRTHLQLGLFFAISCLIYNSGVMLVGVYLASSLRRNRLLHLIASASLALSARPLWQAVLGTQIKDEEAKYLAFALEHWFEILESGIPSVLNAIFFRLSEHLFFFDSPLVVVAGAAACLTVKVAPSLRWLIWTTIGIPIMASMVFSPVATARGYLVYGASIWIYACLAAEISRGLTAQHYWPRKIVQFSAALLVVSHFAWSSAHLAGFLGPVKTYFLGWPSGFRYLFSPPAEVISLTGQEPTPVLFGGNSSLEAAGAHAGEKKHILDATQRSFGMALLSRAWFFAYAAALTFVTAVDARHRAKWLCGLLVLYLVSSAIASKLMHDLPAFFSVDRAVPLDAGQTIHYEIEMSRDFLDVMQQGLEEGSSLVLFTCGEPFLEFDHPDVNVSFRAGLRRVPAIYAGNGTFVLDAHAAQQMLDDLAAHRLLLCEISNTSENDTSLSGWQRSRLPSRHCFYRGGDDRGPRGPDVLPIIELRLLRPNGIIQTAGF